MKFTVLAVGKCTQAEILGLVEMYTTRLRPYVVTQLVELPDGRGQTREQTQQKEAESFRKKIPDGAYVIALDERGKGMTTSALAKHLGKQRDEGVREVVFLIGGAEGHTDDLRLGADLVLKISDMTLAHMLVRPVLLEQLYRVATLWAGHPYHRED
jgi:23S rRNA (pseudouridine1915-N3)-methyltransferase